MKRLSGTSLWIAALFVLGALGLAYAAGGTATVAPVSLQTSGNTAARFIKITWVDDGNGTTKSVTATPLGINGWVLYNCKGNPGTHALTDNFDMYLYDSDGIDLMGGAMVNSDNATSADYWPTLGSQPVNGNLTFTLSGNSQNGGNGTLTCCFFPN